MSLHADPQAIAVDAFLQDWSNGDHYAFPPFAVIRKVLNKFRGSRNCRMTLVAPWWPQREWFPDLLSLVVEEPRLLPLRRDLLRQPLGRAVHLNLPMLHLTAWRLSTVSSDFANSPARFRSQFTGQGDLRQMHSISRDGPHLFRDADLERYLPPGLP